MKQIINTLLMAGALALPSIPHRTYAAPQQTQVKQSQLLQKKWEKSFSNAPHVSTHISKDGSRIVVGTDKEIQTYSSSGELISRFLPPEDFKASKVLITDLSSDGTRALCYGFIAQPNSDVIIKAVALLVNTTSGSTVLSVPLKVGNQTTEKPFGLSADGQKLLIAGIPSTSPTKLVGEDGKVIWKSDKVTPQLKIGSIPVFFSPVNMDSFILEDNANILEDNAKRLVCISKEGVRHWDMILIGDQIPSFSPNGKYILLHGNFDVLSALKQERIKTWPIVPPSNRPVPDGWEDMVSAPTKTRGTSLHLLETNPVGLGGSSAHSVALQWGHIESWLGSSIDSRYSSRFVLPKMGILSVSMGDTSQELTAVVEHEDGYYLYLWDRIPQKRNLVLNTKKLQNEGKKVEHSIVSDDGQLILTSIKDASSTRTGEATEVLLWNRQGEQLGSVEIESPIQSLKLSGDSKKLVVNTIDKKVKLFEVSLVSKNFNVEEKQNENRQ